MYQDSRLHSAWEVDASIKTITLTHLPQSIFWKLPILVVAANSVCRQVVLRRRCENMRAEPSPERLNAKESSKSELRRGADVWMPPDLEMRYGNRVSEVHPRAHLEQPSKLCIRSRLRDSKTPIDYSRTLPISHPILSFSCSLSVCGIATEAMP